MPANSASFPKPFVTWNGPTSFPIPTRSRRWLEKIRNSSLFGKWRPSNSARFSPELFRLLSDFLLVSHRRDVPPRGQHFAVTRLGESAVDEQDNPAVFLRANDTSCCLNYPIQSRPCVGILKSLPVLFIEIIANQIAIQA